MYWRFRRHRLAVVATFVVAAFYLVAVFCEFVAPMDPNKISNQYRYVPPMPISFIDQNGQFSLRPGVFGLKGSRDPVTLRQSYVQDTTRWTPIHLFVQGDKYKMWGIWPADRHLFGLGETQTAAPAPGAGAAAATAPGAAVTPTGAAAPALPGA